MQKVKTWYICPAIPRHVRGLGVWLKPAGIFYYWERAHLQQKADA